MKYSIKILSEKLKDIQYTRGLLYKTDLSNLEEINKIDVRINEIKQTIFILKFLKNNSLDITLNKKNQIILNSNILKHNANLK